MPRELTVEFILQRAKASSPGEVHVLSLCSLGIERIDCLAHFPNLRVCSLSNNSISDISALSSHPNLTSLYLRLNMLASVSTLYPLISCPSLSVLSVGGNPLSRDGGYRIEVIAILPQIHTLDDIMITGDERSMAMMERNKGYGYMPMQYDQNIGNNNDTGNRLGNGVIQ